VLGNQPTNKQHQFKVQSILSLGCIGFTTLTQPQHSNTIIVWYNNRFIFGFFGFFFGYSYCRTWGRGPCRLTVWIFNIF